MEVKRVPESDIQRKDDKKKVVLVVKKQPGVELPDYLVCIKENGEIIDRGGTIRSEDPIFGGNSIGDKDPIFGGDSIGDKDPIFGGDSIGDKDPIFGGDPIGDKGPTFGKDPIGGEELKDPIEEEKETEKKKSPIGKYIRRGIAVGLAALIIAAVASTKQITHDTTITQSDYSAAVEVSDINLIYMEGHNIQYAGSVYEDPGKLIHDMRDAAIGENNGTFAGISEYFATTTDQSRVAEEERILEISKSFQEQQAIIAENEAILKSQASDVEKRQALENIIKAKGEIKIIYEKNQDLYNKYADIARKAYGRDGGDSRTGAEKEMTYLGETEYYLAIQNLDLDIASLNGIIGTLDNPGILFKEPPAPVGTVDTKYIIDMEVFDHEIKAGEISSTEVTDLEYDPSIGVNEGGTTVTNGQVVVTEKAIQDTQTTRKGIFAVADIIKRAIEGKEIGEISIFGKKVHDDPHI